MKDSLAFLLSLAVLAVLIVVLTRTALWMSKSKHTKKQDRQIDHEHYDRYAYPHQPPEIVVAHRLDAIGDQLDAQRRQQDHHEHKRRRLEIVGVSAAIIAAGLAGYSAWIFQGQLEEMRNDKRAWIPVQVTVSEGLTFNPDPRMGLRFELENVGNSPALQVDVIAILYRWPNAIPIIDYQKSWCDFARIGLGPASSPAVSGVTIFPGEKKGHGIEFGVTASQKERDFWVKNTDEIALFAVGCIVYRTRHEGDVHVTPFNYRILAMSDDGKHFIPIGPSKDPLAATRVVLTEAESAGAD